jgi:hypothetical protein
MRPKSKSLGCILLAVLLIYVSLHGQTCDTRVSKACSEQVENPPKIGNFVFPPSQQPGPLFGFGGNIIDKEEIQLYFFADEFIGSKKVLLELIPSILFGITDDCSIYFNFPFAPLLRDDQQYSNGLQDFFIQMEYAFYNKKTVNYSDQATVVGNVTFPTGSASKNPPTGFGSASFFLGATFCRMMVDWFVFTSHGGIFTTTNNRTKIGEQFLYQFGFGRNFPSPVGWIYAWMLEFDRQYSKKNRIHGDLDSNSGGNVIYATPSLWVSSKEMLVQFGVSVPIVQNLFGNQTKVAYVFNFNIAWSFY